MLNTMVNEIQLAVLIAIWSWTWGNKLLANGEVFGWFVPLWYKIVGVLEVPHAQWTKVQYYLIKVVVGCASCHAGTVALIYSLLFAKSIISGFWIIILATFFTEFLQKKLS